MNNQTLEKVSRITNRNSVVIFVLTILTFAALDLFVVTPWLRSIMDGGFIRSTISFLVTIFVFVLTSAVFDVIGSYVNAAMTRGYLESDAEIQAELQREGMSVDSFIKQNQSDQLHLAISRVLHFYDEAPMAILVHIICLAVIRFIM